MSAENPGTADLPENEHLRNDVAAATEHEQEDPHGPPPTPGLSNAGQQVGGLVSAVGYDDKQEPDEMDPNHPV